MVEPGDEIAAGADGGSRLIASQADREQVLDALKAAFVQGRLTKDEFDQRVGRVLATYAELAALIADIPAGPTESQLPELARESHNRKVIQRGTAVGAGASMAFTAALVMVGGNPAVALIAGSASRPERKGTSAPGISRLGQTGPADQSRYAAHGRGCTEPPRPLGDISRRSSGCMKDLARRFPSWKRKTEDCSGGIGCKFPAGLRSGDGP